MKTSWILLPRGSFDGAAQALRAKRVAIAATGATAHHLLALDSIAAILRGFFAAYVVPRVFTRATPTSTPMVALQARDSPRRETGKLRRVLRYRRSRSE
jgi:hypothetical protein